MTGYRFGVILLLLLSCEPADDANAPDTEGEETAGPDTDDSAGPDDSGETDTDETGETPPDTGLRYGRGRGVAGGR